MDFYFYNRHYIAVDERGRIVDAWSDGPHPERDTTGAICINEQGGYQFRIYDGGEENPVMFDMDGIPLYKYANGAVEGRSADEIDADRKAILEPPPSPMEQMRADVDFILAMEGWA